jgi:Cd(II)/Pb(II)-responsive transcriptional regulator
MRRLGEERERVREVSANGLDYREASENQQRNEQPALAGLMSMLMRTVAMMVIAVGLVRVRHGLRKFSFGVYTENPVTTSGSSLMKRSFTIGALARDTECPPETIRYYEREGLLPPASRTAGNYRLYGGAHLERLVFIRNCRSLDMTLDEIKQLLRFLDVPQSECGAAHALIDEHIAHIGERIAELEQLHGQLQALRRQCQPVGDAKKCGILDRLEQKAPGSSARKKTKAHIRGAHGPTG